MWLLEGGHAWLLVRGVCMVAGGGHAWLLVKGMCGCWWGACRIARRHDWLFVGGACMVAGREVCMVAGGEACMVAGRGSAWLPGACIGYDEIQSMSRWYASYWNAFLL